MHVIDVIEIWGERLSKKYNATISMHKVFQVIRYPQIHSLVSFLQKSLDNIE